MNNQDTLYILRVVALTTCVLPTLATGEVVTASSCSQSAVQSAVNAVSSGATVLIPPGTCTWSSVLTVTKAISIQGAGIGSTIINANINSPYGTALITYAPTVAEVNNLFELSGITCDAGYKTGCFKADSPNPKTAITGLTIHHNKFSNGYSRAILLSGLEFGVFYSNQFQNNYIAISPVGSELDGWNYPYSQGGANYPFFEDNVFNQTVQRGGFIVESGRGGRVVFRNNTITGYDDEVWDAHGVNGTYPSDTGTVGSEYYNNTIGLTGSSRVFFHRGGPAIVFNNRVTGRDGALMMTEYQGWSYCSPDGYPKPEQVTNSYYWANTTNGAPMIPSLYCTSGTCTSCGQYDSTYIKLNRDYWLPISGTDSNKPATCSVGSRYGAVDTGKLYACNSVNVWTNIYTPYPYPHPLRSGSPLTPPAPPANLQWSSR